ATEPAAAAAVIHFRAASPRRSVGERRDSSESAGGTDADEASTRPAFRRGRRIARGFTSPSPDVHTISTLTPERGGDTRTVTTVIQPVEVARAVEGALAGEREVVFDIDGLSVDYGRTTAFSDVSLDVYKNRITAVI